MSPRVALVVLVFLFRGDVGGIGVMGGGIGLGKSRLDSNWGAADGSECGQPHFVLLAMSGGCLTFPKAEEPLLAGELLQLIQTWLRRSRVGILFWGGVGPSWHRVGVLGWRGGPVLGYSPGGGGPVLGYSPNGSDLFPGHLPTLGRPGPVLGCSTEGGVGSVLEHSQGEVVPCWNTLPNLAEAVPC